MEFAEIGGTSEIWQHYIDGQYLGGQDEPCVTHACNAEDRSRRGFHVLDQPWTRQTVMESTACFTRILTKLLTDLY